MSLYEKIIMKNKLYQYHNLYVHTQIFLILVDELSSGIRVSDTVSQELSVATSDASLDGEETEIGLSSSVLGVISLDVVDDFVSIGIGLSVGISQENGIAGSGDFLGVDGVDDESGGLRDVAIENNGVLLDGDKVIAGVARLSKVGDGGSTVGLSGKSACGQAKEERDSNKREFHMYNVEGNIQIVVFY